MSKSEKNRSNAKMTTVIQGHEVILLFTEMPNPQIALQVKQALLGTYMPPGTQAIVVDEVF